MPLKQTLLHPFATTANPTATQSLTRTFQALLSRWPADPLRPTAHLGTILAARLSAAPPPPPTKTTSPSSSPSPTPPSAATITPAQVRATAALLDDAFAKAYALRPDRSVTGAKGLMRPRSNPEYYEVLMRDLEEVPTRTWWGRMKIRVGGMFRWT